ncbi:MAG: ABC transporter substrate-binding protein [Oscillospiraceae bacterium]|nr:ABC transporter substrate-binding protein [Oscillospiraceae bacterium]
MPKIAKTSKCIVAGMLAALSVFSITACTSEGSSADTPSQAQTANTQPEKTYQVDTLRMAAYGGDRGGPNPFLQKSGGPADQKVRYIFDSLLNEGTKELDPWLAESYSVDGNVYTFKLHQDAMWHDGEKVTADDVAFTVNYYQKHTPTSQLIFSGDYNNLTAKVLDEYTVQITANENDSTVLGFIGSMFILPQHIWESVEDPLTFTDEKAYVGCGMYKFNSYDPTTGAYSYIAFDDYYGPKVAAREIDFVPVSDELLAFENGEIDLAGISADLAEEYGKKDGVGIISKDDDMIYQIYLNHEKVPEFADFEVRKAIYQAIDRESIVQNIWRGYGTVTGAGLISPTNTRFYTDEVEQYDYDVEAARKVLEGKNISFTLTCPESYTGMAEIVKKTLTEIADRH